MPIRYEGPWPVAAVGRHPGCMEEPEAARGRQAGDDIAVPAGRFIVILGKPAGRRGLCRPDRRPRSATARVVAAGGDLRADGLGRAAVRGRARGAASGPGNPPRT
jgi:hypothetical protein